MKIKMPDDVVYDLDLDLNYEQRLQLVKEITSKYKDYFNQYWEGKINTNGNYTHKVKTTLDIIGSYLFYGDEKDEILTERQIKRRCGEIEIPVNFSNAETTENFINDYKEKTKKKKIQSNYHNSKTHRLTTLRIPVEQRKNETIEDESKIHTHIFSIVNGKFEYKNVKDKEIKIDCFTNDDLKLPYIPSNVQGQWIMVYGNKEKSEQPFFFLDNKKYVIKGEYSFDKILLYQVGNKKYFFNPNIEQIKDFSKH